jgi:hypothetical protein
VNQHAIKIRADLSNDLATPLLILRCDHDISKRTEHQRLRTVRSRHANQRIELKAKRTTAERERFDEYSIGRCYCEGREKGRAPLISQRFVNRPAIRIDELSESGVMGLDRRKLDNALGRLAEELSKRLSSGDKGHPDPLLSQCVHDPQCAAHVADAEQVLNIE